MPAGCFEVSVSPGSEPRGTQSHSISVMSLGLVLQGRRLGPDEGSSTRAGCLLTSPRPSARGGVDPACLAGVEMPEYASAREGGFQRIPPAQVSMESVSLLRRKPSGRQCGRGNTYRAFVFQST